MASSFWNSWQLWEKLCFVLACAIVMVICFGCLKLAYNAWSLRKYTKIAATKAALKQEMQHSRSVRRGRAKQIPFGVRALESGIEVDGVWVSRTNTPASSHPGSPAFSAASSKPMPHHPDLPSGRASTISHMTRVEISQPGSQQPEVNNPIDSSSNIRNPFDRPPRRHEPPPTSDHQPRGRPTYQPRQSSHLRFSNSFDPDDSETLEALGGPPTLTEKDGKRPIQGSQSGADDGQPSESWSGSSSNTGNEDLNKIPPSQGLSNGYLHPRYHNHPKFHTPTSHELTSLAPTSVVYDHIDDPHTKKSAISLNEANNPFITPEGSPKVSGIAKLETDDNIADQHTRLIDDDGVDFDAIHTQPLQPFDGSRRLRRSQVIRKINSGFEILRPGTLDEPRPVHDDTRGKPEATNKRELKKLQKRGRASSKSSYTLET